ncbi:hypothetical protein [Nocardioides sp. W7]|uniref:hypothetical protein n=1 Tax=Nocardioides sp. W7 TaxID=2931390 RepID=UPI001FD46832|nr:hypothetical protein [Nocardioides sp. W7]
MQNTPAVQRAVGLGLGAVVLGLLIVLAVALPKAQGETGSTGAADLPATLPGGWTATDALKPDELPAEAGIDAEAIERQAERRAFAEQAYAEVYDDAPSFRTYTDESLQKFALVTVFAGEAQAFAPGDPPVDAEAEGMARSTSELVRQDDALCSVSYQAVAAGQDAGAPTSISCQLPTAGQTIQVQAQGVTVEEAFALLDELATAVA